MMEMIFVDIVKEVINLDCYLGGVSTDHKSSFKDMVEGRFSKLTDDRQTAKKL
jgi:hypothetical protein